MPYTFADFTDGQTLPASRLNPVSRAIEALSRGFDAISAKTGNYTATTDDRALAFTLSGAATLTLYTAVGNDGKMLTVWREDTTTNALTIDGNASETINGATTFALYGLGAVTLIARNGNWSIEDGAAFGGRVKSVAHKTTAYIAGDGSAHGCMEVYSQIAAMDHDLVLITGSAAGDIHLVRLPGGSGQVFIGLPIKVSSTTLPSGLEVRQDDNSVVMIFPSSGGRIRVNGTLEGDNGANDDLLLRNGTSSGLLKWLNAAGSAVFTIDNSGTVVIGGNATITAALDHNGTTVGLFGKTPATQPAANPDTSGATLAALETEVNELKAALRSLGIIAT